MSPVAERGTVPRVSSNLQTLSVIYPVPRWSPRWAVPEVPVPESDLHDCAIEYVRALLEFWLSQQVSSGQESPGRIARNLGIRWVEEEPKAGFDPDLCLLSPIPPDQPLTSLRLWQAGHHAPKLAIEVVSPGHPYKDYVDTPERCGACGISELWVYDPLLAGPRQHGGGPFLLQVWRLEAPEAMRRVYAGDGPAYSEVLGAHLHPTATTNPHQARLRIGSADGQKLWLTRAEHERNQRKRVERERERAQKELERAQKELERAQKALEKERERADAESAKRRRLQAELERLRKG